MSEQLLTAGKRRAAQGLDLSRSLVAKARRRVADRVASRRGTPPLLPAWDDADVLAAIGATEHLNDDERRQFLASLYRVVVGWERTGDVRLLTNFARQAVTTAQLWSRADFRAMASRSPNAVLPEETLTVHDMLAKLGS